MAKKSGMRMALALVLGVAICVVSNRMPGLIKGILAALAIQGTMLILSLIMIAVLSRGRFSEYGFRKATDVPWLRVILIALGLGMVATIFVLLFRSGGHPMAGRFSFVQMVLFVWLLASTSEEIFTRGLFQTMLSPWDRKQVNMLLFRVNLPTLVSALLFSAMHIVVKFSGASTTTTVTIMVFTFSVGLLAGHARARSGSLVPAVAVHMMANVGGFLGGIVFTMIKAMITGQPPM